MKWSGEELTLHLLRLLRNGKALSACCYLERVAHSAPSGSSVNKSKHVFKPAHLTTPVT